MIVQHIEIKDITEITPQLMELRTNLLCSDIPEKIDNDKASCHYIAGLAYLDLAVQAFQLARIEHEANNVSDH